MKDSGEIHITGLFSIAGDPLDITIGLPQYDGQAYGCELCFPGVAKRAFFGETSLQSLILTLELVDAQLHPPSPRVMAMTGLKKDDYPQLVMHYRQKTE
ncbi:MAG: hypothetical protein U5N55_13400 [Cypionkella sp.]|nr:hypothetical protein [Cypionkella sp.]